MKYEQIFISIYIESNPINFNQGSNRKELAESIRMYNFFFSNGVSCIRMNSYIKLNLNYF